MENKDVRRSPYWTHPGWVFSAVLLGIGLAFRLINLDNPFYWVDEVATSIRVSGYTQEQVVQQVATGDVLSVEDLHHYQQLTPERDWADTFHALKQSPEHAPLYFILARLWVQMFGSSVAAIRSLSVVCSLVAVPCFYRLAVELFKSPRVGWMAVGLLSVSPFFVAYAQEARPYSLWSVTLLLSGVALLRAMRLNTKANWGVYALTLSIIFYTSLLSVFVALGQGIYVVLMSSSKSLPLKRASRVRHYWIATGLGLLAFSPWLLIIAHQWVTLQTNTTWMREPMNFGAIAGILLYNLAILFFDVPVSLDLSLATFAKVAVSLMLVSMMGYTIYVLRRKSPKSVWLFVITFANTLPVSLLVLDLVSNGQTSTAARYLMPLQLGMLLAIAHLLIHSMHSSPVTQALAWRGVAIALVSLSIGSCLTHWHMPPKYQKSRNLSNEAIAAIVNQAEPPLVIAEADQTLDIISLSYMFNSSVRIALSSDISSLLRLSACDSTFVFNPSSSAIQTIRADDRLDLNEVYQPKRLIAAERSLSLWTVTPVAENCL
ncbi:MAG TPA: glycosyltransferase family 39 protein [Elainellaceae cyanobacterium]